MYTGLYQDPGPTEAYTLLKPAGMITQQTRHVGRTMYYCRPNVCDAGPTLKHHCFNVSCLLGSCNKSLVCEKVVRPWPVWPVRLLRPWDRLHSAENIGLHLYRLGP